MNKKTISIFIFVLVITGIILGVRRDKLPKDPIARYVVEKNNGKISYIEKSENDNQTFIGYHFLLTDYEDKELLDTVLQTFKEAANLYDHGSQWKHYSISLWEKYSFPNAVTSRVITLSNYDKKSSYIYDDFQNAEILGFLNDSPDIIYNQAETYLQLKNIRKLTVSRQIDNNTKACGINWYDTWPELVSYEVRKQ